MYNNVLQSIDNIALWPVISFIIFFLFFICLLLYVFTVDREFINGMAVLPLQDYTTYNELTSPPAIAATCCKDQKQTGDSTRRTAPLVKLQCQHNCEKCRKKREKSPSRRGKKLAMIPLLMMISVAGWAQDAGGAAPSFWSDPIHDPKAPVYFILVALAVILALVIQVVSITISALKILKHQAGVAEALLAGIPYVPSPPWWTSFWEKVNGLKPLAEEKDIELDHNYDGITELDNHLPPWWKGLFYATIGFAVVYLFVFHVIYVFPLQADEYEKEVAVAADQQRIRKASQPREVIDENTLNFTIGDPLIARGKAVFTSNNCGSCHRNDGGGNIGPNLTDTYWLHGGSAPKIFATIRDGVVEKAMPAWGKVMTPVDVKALTFYVMSLRGSNPPNPKKPQGEIFQPEPIKLDTSRIQAALQ